MKALRHTVLFTVIFAATTVYAVTASSNPGETEAIRACYDGFKKALSSKDGEQASNFICAKSLQYYGDMLDLALHAEAKKLEPLTLADKYLVLSIRHRAPFDQISTLTPKSVYVLAVSKAWLGVATTNNRTVDTVTLVSAEKAQVSQQVTGTKTNETIIFLKEDGKWKVDLEYQNVIINAMLAKALKESALTEKDFFEHILSVATNKRVLHSIWEPLMTKPVESASH